MKSNVSHCLSLMSSLVEKHWILICFSVHCIILAHLMESGKFHYCLGNVKHIASQYYKNSFGLEDPPGVPRLYFENWFFILLIHTLDTPPRNHIGDFRREYLPCDREHRLNLNDVYLMRIYLQGNAFSKTDFYCCIYSWTLLKIL